MNYFEEQADQALDLINKSNKILIVPSSPVDGDALGSALGLRFILEKLGKKVTVNYSFDRFDSFKFLPGGKDITVKDLYDVDLSLYDLAILVDGGNLRQFYDDKIHNEKLQLPANTPVINIDHHPTNEKFTPNMVWKLDVSSACEVIYLMFKDKVEWDQNIATCLYCGIATDTGSFKYNNTRPETLRIAAELLSFGVDLPNLWLNLDGTVPLNIILFALEIMQGLKVNQELKYAYVTIPFGLWSTSKKMIKEHMKRSMAMVRDDFIRRIDGLDFIFVLSEDTPGYIDVSMRTRISGSVDLIKLASFMSGGGHKDAAGASIKDKTMDQAADIINKIIKEHYDEIKTK